MFGGDWFSGNTLLNFSQCKGMRGNGKGFFNYYNINFKKNQAERDQTTSGKWPMRSGG